MKTKSLIILALISFCVLLNLDIKAQDSFSLEFIQPSGHFAKSANSGVGVLWEFGFPTEVSDRLTIHCQFGLGYISTGKLDVSNINLDRSHRSENWNTGITQIQPLIGGRYYFDSIHSGFFVSGLAGFTISAPFKNEGTVSTDFTLCPEVGYHLSEKVVIGLRNQLILGHDGSQNAFALRIGYSWN
jgi:hypothetical protein